MVARSGGGLAVRCVWWLLSAVRHSLVGVSESRRLCAGLGPTVARYGPALRARGLDGAKLLMLRCDDLEYLGMHIIGHQELLLEAVEHLRNFVSPFDLLNNLTPLIFYYWMCIV